MVYWNDTIPLFIDVLKISSNVFSFYSDFTIKIVEVATGATKKCEGHEAPVLSVALDPKQEFLVSDLGWRGAYLLKGCVDECKF